MIFLSSSAPSKSNPSTKFSPGLPSLQFLCLMLIALESPFAIESINSAKVKYCIIESPVILVSTENKLLSIKAVSNKLISSTSSFAFKSEYASMLLFNPKIIYKN